MPGIFPSLTVLVVVLLWSLPTCNGQAITVYTVASPPFISGAAPSDLEGFEVELLEELLARMQAMSPGLTWRWQVEPSVADVLSKTARCPDSHCIGTGAISITSERLRNLTFSDAFHLSGLDILTKERAKGGSLFQWFRPFSIGVWVTMIVLTGFSGLCIWLLERDYQPDAFPRSIFLGINEGIWYCWGTLSGAVQKNLVGFPARMYSVGYSLLSIIIVAAYTANFATLLTVQEVTMGVDSTTMLSDRAIGVVAGTAAEAYLASHGGAASVQAFDGYETAVSAVVDDVVDGVLGDSPMLLYYMAEQNYDSTLKLLGDLVAQQRYAFALPRHTTHERSLNRVLSMVDDEGGTDFLFDKWFNRVPNADDAFVAFEASFTFRQLGGVVILLLISLVVAIISCIWFAVYRFV